MRRRVTPLIHLVTLMEVVVSVEAVLEPVQSLVCYAEGSPEKLVKVLVDHPFEMEVISHTDVDSGQSRVSIHTSVAVTVSAAGNGSSTNGSTGPEMPKRPRKQPRRPETNQAKGKRARGDEYVSPSTGKTVPARAVGERCKYKCHCFDLFTENERSSVVEAFNKLASKELQDSHLFGLVTSHPIKRRRPRQVTKGGSRNLRRGVLLKKCSRSAPKIFG